MEIYHVP